MLIAVLTIGVLNLALGFFLAVLLERPAALNWAGIRGAPRRRLPHKPITENVKSVPELPHVSSPPIVEPPASTLLPTEVPPASKVTSTAAAVVWDGLPEPWVAKLQSDNLAPQSFAEGALWFIHRSVPEYRNRLIAMMDRLVDTRGGTPSSEEIQQPANAWLEQISQWVSVIQTARPQNQESAVCNELGQVLDEQLVKIQFAVTECQQLTLDAAFDCNAVMQPLRRLVATMNAVRDGVEQILCRLLRQAKRFADIPAEFHFDEPTQAFSCIGLAKQCEDWIRNDPTRVRLACGVVVDVDGYSEINNRLGEKRGDLLLTSLGILLQSLIRKERGFDRISRIGGQRFLLFFGDTALRNAMNSAERIRSHVQAALFKFEDETIRLTVSCAVSEWSNQPLDEWLQSAQRLLTEAKNAGRNCTCVNESNGPRVIARCIANIAPREIVVGKNSGDAEAQ